MSAGGRIASCLVALWASVAAAAPPGAPLQLAIDKLVRTDLAASKAATTTDLAPKLPPRSLGTVTATPVPHSGGRTWRAIVALDAAGGPFHVPTELSLVYVLSVTGSTPSVVSRPSRDDLAAAARLAATCEAKVLDLAGKALDAIGRKPPMRTWSSALTTVRLDPRLPAGQFVGAPSWQLLFNPMVEEGGWNSVLLDAQSCTVTNLNGKSL